MIRFSHTLFALPFALLAAVMAWTPGGSGRSAGGVSLARTAGHRRCAWSLPAARRWPSTGWPIGGSTPRIRAPRCGTFPAGLLSVGQRDGCSRSPVRSALRGRDAVVPAQPLAAVPVAAGAGVFAGLQLHEAIHGAGPLLARRGADAGADRRPGSRSAASRCCDPGHLLPPVVLGGAVLLWVAGFDIIYACQDVEFDRQAGLHSVPARLGVARALAAGGRSATWAWSFCWRCCRWSIRSWAGSIWPASRPWRVLLVYEHWLVRPDDLTRVNMAFFQVNAVVSIGLFVVGQLGLARLGEADRLKFRRAGKWPIQPVNLRPIRRLSVVAVHPRPQ